MPREAELTAFLHDLAFQEDQRGNSIHARSLRRAAGIVTLFTHAPPGAHEFVGRLDRSCEVCNRPDRDSIHVVWPISDG